MHRAIAELVRRGSVEVVVTTLALAVSVIFSGSAILLSAIEVRRHRNG